MARALVALGITVVTAGVWLFVMPPAPLAQPIAFNHAKHTDAGMGCVACHAGVEDGVRAGIPQITVCQKCHTTPPSAVDEAVWTRSAEGARIDWVRITRVPDHTVFSHRRHVGAARLTCETCHGEMATRTTPPVAPATLLDMDTCIACHVQEDASEDCAACHR